MTVAVGILTYNRAGYAEKTLRACRKNLSEVVDTFYVHNDGSSPKFAAEYKRAYKQLPDAIWQLDDVNRGVAVAKNAILREALADGHEWIFLLEDDVLPLSAEAVTSYIKAAQLSGMSHLSFAHHGSANANVPDGDGPVSYFPHSIGAWTMFHRRCLEGSGLFDEHLHNAWEHVEHELRLINDGWMPGAVAHKFPDATGSTKWLSEIPGSINASSIRVRDDWSSNIRDGLRYWRDAKPETYDMLFGDDKPLHNYALSIIGE